MYALQEIVISRDYPGHPVNAKLRAQGKPEHESQVGDITLEDDVWLATGVKVMPGVTIWPRHYCCCRKCGNEKLTKFCARGRSTRKSHQVN